MHLTILSIIFGQYISGEASVSNLLACSVISLNRMEPDVVKSMFVSAIAYYKNNKCRPILVQGLRRDF